MFISLKSKVKSLKSVSSERLTVSSCFYIFFAFLITAYCLPLAAQTPSPKAVLGFQPTDDKTIADWSQITNYFARLDAKSDKVSVREIGKTTLGKPLIVAFISSPENIKNLEKYRRINSQLANPNTVKDAAELENLVRQGKTIVSISCSIHSTEIVASQMSMNLAYELASATDAGTPILKALHRFDIS